MRSTETRFIHSIVRITRAIAIAFNMTIITVLAMTMPTQGAIIHVNHASTAGSSATGESWTLAYEFLSDGLANANPETNDEVWVAAGTYRPDESLANESGTGNRSTSFKLKKDVGVYGGFDGTESSRDQRDPDNNDTILSGDLDENDDYTAAGFLDDPPIYSSMANNSIHVLIALSIPESGQQEEILIDSDTILDGFIIRGGNANAADADDEEPYGESVRGAGLFCGGADEEGDPNRFEDIKSSPTISRSRFEYNHAGNGYAAAIYTSYGDPVLRDMCAFADNHSDNCAGATVIEFYGAFTALACLYQDNFALRSGGAHQSRSQSQHTAFHSCKFIGNWTAHTDVGNGGAITLLSETSEVVNCEFRGNTAPKQGGAARLQNTELVNCTVSGNETTIAPSIRPGSGGIYASSGVTIQNCIIWGNTSNNGSTLEQQVSGPVGSWQCSTTYSDIQGWCSLSVQDCTGGAEVGCEEGFDPATNNLDQDPEFKDTNNLRLTNCSPAIDAGLESYVPADADDIDNDTDSTEATPDADIHERTLDGNGVADEDENEIDMGAFEFDLGCPADLYGEDDTVNGLDLAVLLGDWTGPGTYSSCPPIDASDLSGPDCRVNGADLAVLLGQWGACPEACGSESLMGGGGEEEDDGAIDQLVAWFLAGDMAAIIQWLIEQGY